MKNVYTSGKRYLFAAIIVLALAGLFWFRESSLAEGEPKGPEPCKCTFTEFPGKTRISEDGFGSKTATKYGDLMMWHCVCGKNDCAITSWGNEMVCN